MTDKKSRSVGIAGFVRMLIQSPSGKRRLVAEFPNAILNAGLDRLGTSLEVIPCCQLGSSPVPVDVAQTGLVSYLTGVEGYTVVSDIFVAGAEPYSSSVVEYIFPPASVAINVAEVGVGWATSGPNLFSRALTVDSAGDPTIVAVAVDESLVVQYESRLYPPTADWLGVGTIDGVPYNIKIRPGYISGTGSEQWNARHFLYYRAQQLKASVFTGPIGVNTAGPSGTTQALVNGVYGNYVAGTYERRATVSMGPESGNLAGGIRSVEFWGRGWRFQAEFDPLIPKVSPLTLTLIFALSWMRH